MLSWTLSSDIKKSAVSFSVTDAHVCGFDRLNESSSLEDYENFVLLQKVNYVLGCVYRKLWWCIKEPTKRQKPKGSFRSFIFSNMDNF